MRPTDTAFRLSQWRANTGDVELVRLLLQASADANADLPGGERPLHVAARTGDPEVLQALIDAGAPVEPKQRQGQTPLIWAVAEGHAAAVELLIAKGANANQTTPAGFTPLHYAARNGRLAVTKVLLEAGVDLERAIEAPRGDGGGRPPRKGSSALMLAVENGHFMLAEELLKAGADPNDQRSGYAPLHALTWVRKPNRGDGPDGQPPPQGSGRLSSLEFARRLIAHGAEIDLRLRRGAAGRGRLNHKGATPLLLAAHTADLALMKALVGMGADWKIANADNCTPLMAAAGIGCLAPTEYAGTEKRRSDRPNGSCHFGANVNHVDDNGETAVHGAAYKSLPRVARWLDQQGADVDIWMRKNKYGWNPVMIAEGHRPGNFKPSAETLESLHQILRRHGRTPPARRHEKVITLRRKAPNNARPGARPDGRTRADA